MNKLDPTGNRWPSDLSDAIGSALSGAAHNVEAAIDNPMEALEGARKDAVQMHALVMPPITLTKMVCDYTEGCGALFTGAQTDAEKGGALIGTIGTLPIGGDVAAGTKVAPKVTAKLGQWLKGLVVSKKVTNPIPKELARVIPSQILAKTLGREGG